MTLRAHCPAASLLLLSWSFNPFPFGARQAAREALIASYSYARLLPCLCCGRRARRG